MKRQRIFAGTTLLLVAFVAVVAQARQKPTSSIGGGFTPAPQGSVGVGVIDIFPGDDWNDSTVAYAESTWFRIKPGVHRVQAGRGAVLESIYTGQVFWGEEGAILSGGDTLTGWVLVPDRNGAGNDLYYTVTGVSGYSGANETIPFDEPCWGGATDSGCIIREDLIVNNKDMLWQRWVIDSVTTDDHWYWDVANDTIWIHQPPAGKIVEISTRVSAINNQRVERADNVAIINLIIEKFAVAANGGVAVFPRGEANGWRVQDCEIRFNHGGGVGICGDMIIERCYIHHNGQVGISGNNPGANPIIARNNELSYNDAERFAWGYHSGGAKTLNGNGHRWEGNHVHHNQNWGLWFDGDSNSVCVNNLIEFNHHGGIALELPYEGAAVSGNTLKHNSRIDSRQGVHVDIVDSDSPSEVVSIIGNTMENADTTGVPAYFGRFMLRVDNDARSDGLLDLRVRYNDFIWGNLGEQRILNTGGNWSFEDGSVLESSFDYNTYTVGTTPAAWAPFRWAEIGAGSPLEFSEWQTWSLNDLNSTHDSS